MVLRSRSCEPFSSPVSAPPTRSPRSSTSRTAAARPGQAAVDFLAAPINPADLLNLRGQYGVVPTLPANAGFEGVGLVTAVGPGVDHIRVGDRVLLGGGTWRERHILSAAGLFALPPGLPSEQLAMLTVNPLTARALIHDAQLQPGQWVIKNAANSGVGRAFFTLAKKAGARGSRSCADLASRTH
ncbi:alcohol dehydrogenase catalytic domain-containing protein [Nannocystis pusilla]|uniref:alcohol dehydrogenase catalytic domain-containing protein n=1 Tax=Nannocystis pusilla TaxID=889268 RepID=UPI003B7BCF6B